MEYHTVVFIIRPSELLLILEFEVFVIESGHFGDDIGGLVDDIMTVTGKRLLQGGHHGAALGTEA